MATAVAEGSLPKEETNPLWHAVIVVIAGLIAVQMAQPQTLGVIPFKNLLKNEMNVDRTANAAFFFWIGLAWYFKPFAGIFTDAFPFLGTRRKSYIMAATSLAILFWIVLAFTPHRYEPFLVVTMIVDVFMVITSTVVGGYMVKPRRGWPGLAASLRCLTSSLTVRLW